MEHGPETEGCQELRHCKRGAGGVQIRVLAEVGLLIMLWSSTVALIGVGLYVTWRCVYTLWCLQAECDAPVCWICLDGPSTGHPLTHPCSCPSYVHSQCLARWQLQSAGSRCADESAYTNTGSDSGTNSSYNARICQHVASASTKITLQ